MRDRKGERLFRHVSITIVMPEPMKKIVRRYRPQGVRLARFNSAGVQEVLEKHAEYLEQRFPLMEFRLVERGLDVFSFIFKEWKGSYIDDYRK